MKNKGITLIALIITIIVLLILAGVVNSLIIGESGILNKTSSAGEDYSNKEMKEKLQLKIIDLQMEKLGNVTLQDLKIIQTTDSLIEQIELNDKENPTEALVWMGGYIFTVDKHLKIIGEYKENQIIPSYKPEINSIGAHHFTITVDVTSKEGNMVSYAFYINGVLEKQDTQASYTKEDCEPSTRYEIYVIVTDEKGNKRKSIVVTQNTKKEMLFTNTLLQSGSTYGNVLITQQNVNGTYGLSMTGTSSSAVGTETYTKNIRWYKQVDMTEYTKLTFYVKKGVNHGGVYIYIDGNEVLRIPYPNLSTQWKKFEIDVSEYIGIHELGIVGGYVDNSGSKSSNTQYCDIRLTN